MKDIKHWIFTYGWAGALYRALSYSIAPFLSKIFTHPNQITFLVLFSTIGCSLFFTFQETFPYKAYAIFIVIITFMDFCDGSIARYLKLSSTKGALLDSLTDSFVYISILTTIFWATSITLIPIIISLYAIIQSIRIHNEFNIVVYKPSLDHNTDTPNTPSLRDIAKKAVPLCTAHSDSLLLLSISLYYSMLQYWCYYELFRRLLNTALETKAFIKTLKEKGS